MSEQAKDLVRKLLTVNPKKRITAQNALEHPWIKSKHFNEFDKAIEQEAFKNLTEFDVQEC